ncbi:MAG TPA: class 1 isoprenoid biosynthesis enzyme [Chloroflexota bacterium]|nr:class 1 isoprenoid biosynthesis enzyme [Chloroflexota bacterium]HUM67529.1 class 1 isoprenoid biosynthesis enzyme [Chloroflexota bacterium]
MPGREAVQVTVMYESLLEYIGSLLSGFPGSSTNQVLAYLALRRAHHPSMSQDLLPLFVYTAVSQDLPDRAMPLTAAWTLYLAACHLLDDAQDNQNMQQVNGGVTAFGVANVALAQLTTDQDTLCAILDAFSRVTALATNAQSDEYRPGYIRSRAEYFQSIGGKAAAIISTGVWAGGRLGTDDTSTLAILKEFGLAWGMAMQIGDDCLDLADDLARGLYTLPVIEGLAKTEHPEQSRLKQLSGKPSLSPPEVQAVVTILAAMGTMDSCRRVVRAYQMQASAVFNVFPGLEPYFADYVAPDI